MALPDRKKAAARRAPLSRASARPAVDGNTTGSGRGGAVLALVFLLAGRTARPGSCSRRRRDRRARNDSRGNGFLGRGTRARAPARSAAASLVVEVRGDVVAQGDFRRNQKSGGARQTKASRRPVTGETAAQRSETTPSAIQAGSAGPGGAGEPFAAAAGSAVLGLFQIGHDQADSHARPLLQERLERSAGAVEFPRLEGGAGNRKATLRRMVGQAGRGSPRAGAGRARNRPAAD